MKQCCKCGKNLNGGGSGDFWGKAAATGAILVGAPWMVLAGAGYWGYKTFRKHSKDEMIIKCPHCDAKNVVTREEYEQFKK